MTGERLERIGVEGFKSIEKLDLPVGDINILIGANGSGKTNLISLFTFLGHLANGKLRQYVEVEGGAECFFHFGTRHASRIRVDLQVGVNGYHVVLSPNLDDDSLVFEKECCTISSSARDFSLEPAVASSAGDVVLEPVGGESGLARMFGDAYDVPGHMKRYLGQCRVYHFHDTGSHALFKKTNKLVNNAYLERDAANLAPFLHHLQQEHFKHYRDIVYAVKAVAPFFHDFHLEPTGGEGDENILLRWIHAKRDAPLSANVLSDGMARFICLATLIFQPNSLRPSTIVLDEPELGLHPAALEVLADIIKSVSGETQFICSTQSVTFSNWFAPDNFIVVEEKGGVSEFRRPEAKEYEVWLEKYGMGTLWAKGLVGGRPSW